MHGLRIHVPMFCPRSMLRHTERIVPEDIDILLDPAKDRDGSSILPWLPDLPVCQTATTLFLGVPRVRPARPSSAVISASHDGSGSGTSSSHLLSVLRSCSLWELVSLASVVAWLFVCLAS